MFDEPLTDAVELDGSYDDQLDDDFFAEEDSDEELDEIDSLAYDEDDSEAFAGSEAAVA